MRRSIEKSDPWYLGLYLNVLIYPYLGAIGPYVSKWGSFFLYTKPQIPPKLYAIYVFAWYPTLNYTLLPVVEETSPSFLRSTQFFLNSNYTNRNSFY